jgi:lipoprotein-releasing system permease protein
LNFLFAWRYFKAKKSTNAINVIAWVSIVAIMGITFAFIVVLSVFNGFEGLVKSLYSSFYPDIKIAAKSGKTIVLTPQQLQKLAAIKGVKAYSLVAEEKTLLINGDVKVPVNLKGVDTSYESVTGVGQKLIRGNFQTGSADEPALILGNGIENAVGIESDKYLYPLTVYAFKRGMNVEMSDPSQSLAAASIVTSGTFLIQQDIDNKYAITNIDFMKMVMGLGPNEYSSCEVALHAGVDAEDVQKEIQQLLGISFQVENKYEQNQSLYSVMNLEKWAIYGILTLMLIVAAFTMIGSLTMLVLEKQKDIQVLKSIGANNRLIQKIFLSEGLLLAGIGSVTGALLAIVFCWAQVKYKIIAIQGGTFLIDYYPVQLVATDFLLVLLTVSLVAFLASWFPSRRAALQPIELRS